MPASTRLRLSAAARFIGSLIAPPSPRRSPRSRPAGPNPAVVSLHTFTPNWRGTERPWQIGILWDADPRLPLPLIAALKDRGLIVGDNEPYDGALPGDTLHEQVTSRGLAGLLIEVRQDLVATPEKAYGWADLLAEVLAPILARPEMHEIVFGPSRAGHCGR